MPQAALSESFGPTIPLPNPEPVVVEEVGSIGMLLRSPRSYARMVSEDRVDFQPTLMLTVTSLGFYALYGLALGSFAGGNSLWQATLKVPMVLFGTLLLSGPCLYVILSLAGANVSGRQVAAMLAGLAGVSSAVLVVVAPLVWLFGISTASVPFMVVFHVVAWLVAFGCGTQLLLKSLRNGNRERAAAFLWAAVTMVACAQLTTFYRPLLGVTVTKDFREHGRKFFFEHLYTSMVGEQPVAPAGPEQPAAAPTLPTDPNHIPPPAVVPMSN